jgi:predicted O-methyltransferase YrrM
MVRASIKRLLHGGFLVGQKFGIDILPRHFYSEIPDLRRLRRANTWKTAYSMVGIAGADLNSQLAFFRDVMESSSEGGRTVYARACEENGANGYGVMEAQFLFAFIRRRKPKRVLQVGAGVSTSVMLYAASSAGYSAEMLCVDPFPTKFLRDSAETGTLELIERPVEELDVSYASRLQAGDLLFIDSTHTLGPAGEVTRLIVEWLPRLAAGVEVHFHDIMFPYDYMPDTLDGALFFPHEAPLLLAFLCMNPSFEILCSLSMLFHGRRSEMGLLSSGNAMPVMDEGLALSPGSVPSSIYLRKTG